MTIKYSKRVSRLKRDKKRRRQFRNRVKRYRVKSVLIGVLKKIWKVLTED